MRRSNFSELAFQSDLDLIYSTIFDSSKWTQVIQRFETRFSFKSGVIFFGDFREDRVRIKTYNNFADDEIKAYNDYYVFKDNFHEHFINSFIEDSSARFITTGDMKGKRETNQKGETYNEWYRPTDSADVVVIPLFTGLDHSLALSFQSSFSSGAVSRHKKYLLDNYAPHLKRAAVMSIGSDLKLNLNEDSRAILLVDELGKIADVNGGAKALLAKSDSLLSVKDIIKFPHHPAATKHVHEMLKQLSEPWNDKGPAELVCNFGMLRWRLNFSRACHLDKPVLMIAINEEEQDTFPLMHRLTTVEWSITQMLVVGMDVKSISERLNKARETVRTHVKNIYAKTSCNTQVELMRRVERWRKDSTT